MSSGLSATAELLVIIERVFHKFTDTFTQTYLYAEVCDQSHQTRVERQAYDRTLCS